MRTRRQRSRESLQEFEASMDRLIRLAYPKAPEDFRMRFAVQKFIHGIGDCKFQQVLLMERHRNNSEALVQALEYEAAKSPSPYINGFMLSHFCQKIPVSHCRYDGCRKQCCQTNNSKVQESRNDLKKTEDGNVTTVENVVIYR